MAYLPSQPKPSMEEILAEAEKEVGKDIKLIKMGLTSLGPKLESDCILVPEFVSQFSARFAQEVAVLDPLYSNQIKKSDDITSTKNRAR